MRPAPGRGPRPGPPSVGGPDTAPWGLALRAGRVEQANSPELNNEAVLKTALSNREQGRRGCSHEHLAKPSFRAMPLPWARKPQCYQVTTVPGNNLLMQSARLPNCRRAGQPRFRKFGYGMNTLTDGAKTAGLISSIRTTLESTGQSNPNAYHLIVKSPRQKSIVS